MTLKELPTGYQPQIGDLRTHATALGVFEVAIYNGKEWIPLNGMQSRELIQLTGGLANLGRSRTQESERPIAYWRTKGQTAEETIWWASKSTHSNSHWTTPAYGLGEMVWRRSNPTGPASIIEGINLVEGWTDEEDPDCSQPQTWEYRLSESGGTVIQDDLVDRTGLALAIGTQIALQTGEDFDPYPDEAEE